MKTFVSVVMGLGAVLAGNAAPADHVIVAAMSLSDQAGYSWTTAVRDDAQTYVVEGKTSLAGGFTWAKIPMIAQVAERLGRETDSQIEAFFRGRSCVMRFRSTWKTFDELPHPEWAAPDAIGFSMPYDPLAGSEPEIPPETIFIPRNPPPVRERPYTNARLGVTPPHEELALIVSSFTNLQIGSEVVTGTLSDLGAALLLAPGETGPPPAAAAGTFRLWVKDNRVTRYQLKLEGILIVGRKRIHVRQDTETNIRDIGRVALTLPEVVRLKLAQQ
jgi:hypothetical protein